MGTAWKNMTRAERSIEMRRRQEVAKRKREAKNMGGPAQKSNSNQISFELMVKEYLKGYKDGFQDVLSLLIKIQSQVT
jgi:hypothetical protein